MPCLGCSERRLDLGGAYLLRVDCGEQHDFGLVLYEFAMLFLSRCLCSWFCTAWSPALLRPATRPSSAGSCLGCSERRLDLGGAYLLQADAAQTHLETCCDEKKWH